MSESVDSRRGITAYKPPEGGPRFLSDVIIELGLTDTPHVDKAVEEARASQSNVGEILVREGRLSDDDLAHALAARYGLNHIDLAAFEVDPDAANLLPQTAAQRYRAIPLAFGDDGTLHVAMADPSDSLALRDIAFVTHLDVRPCVAAANAISTLAQRLPLSPREGGGSRFPGSTDEPEGASGAAPAAEEPEKPAPAVELEQLRAELDRANAQLALERARYERSVETMRLEFELERESRAASERELHASLMAAKVRSASLVREAQELAAALDDSAR
jgi:hypothetical protein